MYTVEELGVHEKIGKHKWAKKDFRTYSFKWNHMEKSDQSLTDCASSHPGPMGTSSNTFISYYFSSVTNVSLQAISMKFFSVSE